MTKRTDHSRTYTAKMETNRRKEIRKNRQIDSAATSRAIRTMSRWEH